MSLKSFIESKLPHGKYNVAPPHNPFKRHEWESKLLYTIKDVLKDDCVILDYGCGGNATLRYTLKNHHPNSIYYGLDVEENLDDNYGFNNLVDNNNEYFYNIDKLDDVLPKVDGMVLGSVFTHLNIELIEEVLNKTLKHYDRGFQLGFSFFFGLNTQHYNPHPTIDKYYWVVVLSIEWLLEYCEKNNLNLVVNPFVFELDHKIPIDDIKFQSFATIKK
jgi:hypothetical protein